MQVVEKIVYDRGVAGADSLSIHSFPAASVTLSPTKDAPLRRPDRVEVMLVAGLVLATAAQFALCAWFWLA